MNNIRTVFTGALAASLIALGGCAVTRGQEGPGSYVSDAAITTSVKAGFVENRNVDASSIKVETMKGEVILSGFAKNNMERSTADSLARNVSGVRSVRNDIMVRP